MPKKNRFGIIALSLIVVMSLMACGGSFVQNSYKALEVSKVTYEASLASLGDLYKQGQVGEDVKADAIKYGNTYMLLHNQAVASLLTYQSTKTDDSKEDVSNYLSQAAAALSQLLNILKPYIVGGGQ